MIKSKKTKTFTVSSSKTLYIYAVKSTNRITAKKLKWKKIKKKVQKYSYTITTNTTSLDVTDTTTTASTDTASTDTTTDDSSTDDNSSEEATDGSSGEVSVDWGTGSTTSATRLSGSYTAVTLSSNTISLALASSSTDVTDNSDTLGATKTEATSTAVEYTVIEIPSGGSYTLTGEGVNVVVEITTTEAVSLTLSGVTIDNKAMGTASGQDLPVIYNAVATALTIIPSGTNSLPGNASYASAPASGVIYQKKKEPLP